MTPCTLGGRRYSNPTPLGWGDHVRWQHESGWSPTVGERHVIARREANWLRSATFAADECERFMREDSGGRRGCTDRSHHFRRES